LVYATGGFAYGRVDENVALNSVAGTNLNNPFAYTCVAGPNCFLGNSSRTGTGWTAGGGDVLWNNLSVKAEYLYVNLGGGDNVNVRSRRHHAAPHVHHLHLQQVLVGLISTRFGAA
jgi:opacity protein-like surface antigen